MTAITFLKKVYTCLIKTSLSYLLEIKLMFQFKIVCTLKQERWKIIKRTSSMTSITNTVPLLGLDLLLPSSQEDTLFLWLLSADGKSVNKNIHLLLVTVWNLLSHYHEQVQKYTPKQEGKLFIIPVLESFTVNGGKKLPFCKLMKAVNRKGSWNFF